MSLSISSNTFVRGAMTNSGRLLYSAVVYSLKDTFAMMEPECLPWLSLNGTRIWAEGGYLKPPHFAPDEPLGWMTRAEVDSVSGAPDLPAHISFYIQRSKTNRWRAETMLSGRAQRAQLLAQSEVPQSPYTENFRCGEYFLEQTTNLDGTAWPTFARYQVFLPQRRANLNDTAQATDITQVLGNRHELRLAYQLEKASVLGVDQGLPCPVDVADTRALLFGREHAAYYKMKEFAILQTNDPLFLSAVAHTAVTTNWTQGGMLKRTLICAAVAVFLWRCIVAASRIRSNRA
jgi:hypothetical protein